MKKINETTDLTEEDYEHYREPLTTAELMAKWGKPWCDIQPIDGDKHREESKKREQDWMTDVLKMPIVDENRLTEHWFLAMSVAAYQSGIRCVPQHHRSEQ